MKPIQLDNLFDATHPKRHLLPIEIITIAYATLTLLLTFILWGDLLTPGLRVAERCLILTGMAALYLLNQWKPSEATRFLRNLYPLVLLSFWYPDTFNFCQVFPNMDHLFAEADLSLFGLQPSLEFSRALHTKTWSELFYLGYFSYFPMIAVTVLLPLFRSRRLFEKTAFIMVACFYFYYVIYLLLPVAGPQFYFPAIPAASIAANHYPAVEFYFRTHTELTGTPVGHEGLFHWLVDVLHNSGERPTAAFPSSHVGMGIVMMILLYRHNRRIFYVFIPFFLLLCASTVYIKAHYLIDVLGGIASAILFYPFAHWLYGQWHVKEYHRRR